MNDAPTIFQPVFAQNPVAGVIRNGLLTWYIVPKDVWFMDETKYYIPGNFRNPTPNPLDIDDRFAIEVLNNETVKEFQVKMQPYAVSVEAQRTMMTEADDWGDYPGDYTPGVLIDFDKKTLISYYQEMGGEFQDYVPDGWQGRFEIAVPQHIALEYKYWVVDGEDWLKKNFSFA